MRTIDLRVPKQANFSTIEKDLEEIVSKLLSNQDFLKLIYYSSRDALSKPDIEDNNILMDISENNIKLAPDITIPDNDGSIVIITFDNFTPNISNPIFIDNIISFDILCPTRLWMMDNYMLRPYRIMHIIQGLFDKQKLNGIGRVNFVSANLLNLGEYAGYQIIYSVINDV